MKNRLPGPPAPKGNQPCGKARCQIRPHIITNSSVHLSTGYTINPPNHTAIRAIFYIAFFVLNAQMYLTSGKPVQDLE